jgi:hypothetical protein
MRRSKAGGPPNLLQVKTAAIDANCNNSLRFSLSQRLHDGNLPHFFKSLD